MTIGGGGWSPNQKHDPGADGKLAIVGEGVDATHVRPSSDGTRGAIEVSAPCTHLRLRGLSIHGGGPNSIMLSAGSYGTSKRQPILIEIEDCKFVGHEQRGPKFGISANQAQLALRRVEFDLPHSVEHSIYLRNPASPGSTISECVFRSVGGQHLKVVNRPHPDVWAQQNPGQDYPFQHEEGPDYGAPTFVVTRCSFRDWGRDPGRASTCVDIGGMGGLFAMVDCALIGSTEYGGIVVWSGGEWYGPGGEIGAWPAQDALFLQRTYVVLPADATRPAFDLSSVQSAALSQCGFYGGTNCKLGPQGFYALTECNTPEITSLAAQHLGDTLTKPKIRCGDLSWKVSKDVKLVGGLLMS